ncbi:MAG TPA: alpha/beta hydrolase [Polyangiaceae bacterium]|nr:alpha/beta hydrolase [Polyangiaceae bacterium]
MTTAPIVLLPGLDGTGDLFARFLAAAPPGVTVKPVGLPGDRIRDYPELAEWVLERLPCDRVVLVAESFSGPLAILIAEQCERVAGVVLVATFVESPLPRAFRHCPQFIWRYSPPEFLLRRVLTGGDAELAAAVRRAMLTVNHSVVAARVAAALQVNIARELQKVTCPLLYLQAGQDRLVRARSGARLRAVKPDAQFVRIDGPHLLLQARPDEAWIHVSQFVNRVADR